MITNRGKIREKSTMKNKEIQESITNTGAVYKKKKRKEEMWQKCDKGVTNLPGLFS